MFDSEFATISDAEPKQNLQNSDSTTAICSLIYIVSLEENKMSKVNFHQYDRIKQIQCSENNLTNAIH